MVNPRICTHCGKQKQCLTCDHAIPQCLFFAPSNERSIKVPSCDNCNTKSQEGVLKTFLAMFDERVMLSRAREIINPKSRGDLLALRSMCDDDLRRVYLDARLTRLLKKMFQGLRRYLTGDAWTFAPADAFDLYVVQRLGDQRVIRALPLAKDGPNLALLLPPQFHADLDRHQYKFRDFYFRKHPCGTMTLRYDRTWGPNELVLAAYFPLDNEAEKDGG